MNYLRISNKSKSIILTGMVGCFLTSVASISANMVFQGWESQGGWNQWLIRVVIGYSAALIIVVGLFPLIVPKLAEYFDKKLTAN